ncbi:MAG: hypothetical protein JWL81_2206 [Verrucomicrobiales bacterium]|nr:hypothetical protein [Verrucomicrobiales bacterium]
MLGAIGGAVLSVMIRSSLKEARLEKDSLNRASLALHDQVREQSGPITAAQDSATETEKNAKNEELSAKALATEAKGLEDTLAATKKEIEDIGTKKQQMQEEITRILGSSGTPEEILAKIEELKKENDAKVEEVEQNNKEAEVAKKAAAESQTLVTRLKAQQNDRAKAIALTSRTGTVSAVNSEFGFVIVNLGQNQGVSSESKLLVKRGNQLIGKLNIVQIGGNTTVADIVTKSITAGFEILPGDEVIFENSPT